MLLPIGLQRGFELLTDIGERIRRMFAIVILSIVGASQTMPARKSIKDILNPQPIQCFVKLPGRVQHLRPSQVVESSIQVNTEAFELCGWHLLDENLGTVLRTATVRKVTDVTEKIWKRSRCLNPMFSAPHPPEESPPIAQN